MNFVKRCWAEISIDNLLDNLKLIKSRCKTDIMCVVKSNAYGHGDSTIVCELQKAGVKHFAVASIDEAVHLRQNGCTGEILLLGGYLDDCFELAIKNDISLALYDVEVAKKLSAIAVSNRKSAKVHIKLNTGMTRIGFDIIDKTSFETTVLAVKTISELSGIEISGAFTHYAVSDEQNGEEYTEFQFNNLIDFKNELSDSGINIPVWHASNSGAIMNFCDKSLDMVRAGIILYGLYDSHGMSDCYKPVLSLKTVITQIRTVEKDISVSYGRTFTCNDKLKLAILSIGYADGFPRSLSNKGSVIINGKFANVVGRVCMDQIIVDITGIDCNVGDTAIIIGEQDGVKITASDIADIDNTISYEVVCNISMRVPRVYIKDGISQSITKYI